MRVNTLKNHIVGAFCLIACGFSSGCQSQTRPAEAPLTPVTVATVEEYTGSEPVNYSASLVPYTQLPVSFKSAGYVTSILQRTGSDGRQRNLQQGDYVQKDTVLATVRQEDYRHAVDQYAGQLEQAKAAALKSKQDFDRASALYNANALTQPDYDAAKAQYDSAQGTLMTAQAVLSQAQQALSDCELRAPIDGTILNRNVELGTLVSAGTPGFTLGDIHLLKAVFGVPDTALDRITLGKKQGIVTETYAQEFMGQITAISPQADQKSRTFQVEITIPNPKELLKSGMVASLDLGQTRLQRPVLVVPLAAIVSVSERSRDFSVFVVNQEGGKDVARRRTVQTGGAYGNRVAITGVSLGERVIANGATLVVDGQAVRVIP